MGRTVNGDKILMMIRTTSQSHFDSRISRINVNSGGNWLSGF